ncbi:unnamed protein product [Sphenostylis stenocarpa]|uniref:Uncharacterized protein n=1 Tax=Sphenostylis stenocarpa TaxID=92480 RepID=A0AA86STM4_9FABA|nr:unnamed protein product [Sphenostylis stenocarpa]
MGVLILPMPPMTIEETWEDSSLMQVECLHLKLQEDIIRYCRGLNLVWIGKFKAGSQLRLLRQIERFLRGGGVNLGKLGLWFRLKTFKTD